MRFIRLNSRLLLSADPSISCLYTREVKRCSLGLTLSIWIDLEDFVAVNGPVRWLIRIGQVKAKSLLFFPQTMEVSLLHGYSLYRHLWVKMGKTLLGSCICRITLLCQII